MLGLEKHIHLHTFPSSSKSLQQKSSYCVVISFCNYIKKRIQNNYRSISDSALERELMWGHNEMTLIILVLSKCTLLTSAQCHQVLKDTSPGCNIFRQNFFLFFFSVYLVETIKTHKISFMNEFPVAALICLLMISHRVGKVSHRLQSASGNIETHQELS